MFGISYGELFLLLGATAAFIGPKDLPVIARTVGRLTGRAIGYVQLARGQFQSVMQQSQVHQVNKEVQDVIAQIEAIRHEIRTVSFINPGPLSTRLVDNLNKTSIGDSEPEKPKVEYIPTPPSSKDHSSSTSGSSDLHSQATAYARLSEISFQNSGSTGMSEVFNEFTDESGLFTVLPISAEQARLLPNRRDLIKGHRHKRVGVGSIRE